MLSVTLLLCLLIAAATPAAAEPSADREYRIREVRFVGHPAFETEVLKKVLKELRVRRRIPGIWTERPRYAARTVDAGLARLRSFYLSNGYFDARIEISDVTFNGREATITLNVLSGPKSLVRRVAIEGLNEHPKIAIEPNGNFPVAHLCNCLLDARRVAETQGRLDFAVDLQVLESKEAAPVGGESRWVDVTARVQTGSPYLVDRISFSGHYRVNESTLRRAMVLQEHALFDVGKLRSSLARLDGSRLLEPIGPDDVHIQRNPADLTADLTISLRERPRRHWSVSGPIAASGLGSLQASISSRLPPWGRGLFDASTYYATLSLIGLPNPLIRLLPFAPKRSLSPLLALERPYLPGQGLFSGFALSPTRPARTLVTSYGMTHLGRGMRAALGSDALVPLPLLVPVQTPHATVGAERSNAGFLICEPPEARLRWLRSAGAYAADLALDAFRPF